MTTESYKNNNPSLRQPKMQHIRHIKPEFFQHEEVGDLSPLARLAWIGLWTCCDKHGRFEWKPRTLKIKILPYDDIDFGDILTELDDHGFVICYEVDRSLYGYVPNWIKHQGINKREKESAFEYPAPCTPMLARARSEGEGVCQGLGL